MRLIMRAHRPASALLCHSFMARNNSMRCILANKVVAERAHVESRMKHTEVRAHLLLLQDSKAPVTIGQHIYTRRNPH